MVKEGMLCCKVDKKDKQYVKKLGYGYTEVWELGVEAIRIQEPEILKQRLFFHKQEIEKYKKIVQNLNVR